MSHRKSQGPTSRNRSTYVTRSCSSRLRKRIDEAPGYMQMDVQGGSIIPAWQPDACDACINRVLENACDQN